MVTTSRTKLRLLSRLLRVAETLLELDDAESPAQAQCSGHEIEAYAPPSAAPITPEAVRESREISALADQIYDALASGSLTKPQLLARLNHDRETPVTDWEWRRAVRVAKRLGVGVRGTSNATYSRGDAPEREG